MGITRAQIARQLLAEGGMPMKEIKGQNHMLAYITPNEADKLVRLGGQETMTPEGIPAYPEYDNYGYSNQADFDQGNYAASSDPTVSGYADRNMSDDDLKALSYAVKPAPKKTFAQKVVDSIKNVSNFTPFGIARKGVGSLFNKFGTFAQNMRGGLTQKQFEDARRERQRQNRISNIMGRDAPFTEMTLENLRNLGFTGPLDGLLGSTNVTRSGTSDQNFPDRVEGIVSQAPTTFREAMANLNLELGVPRDQVFLSAKDFIDQNKTIGSEDTRNIQSRISDTLGFNSNNIDLTKTFGLEELLKSKAVEPGSVYGYNLTDQGKALDKFRKDATGMNNPKNENFAPYKGLGAQFQLNQLLQNENTNAMENKNYIQEQINQGFLQNPEDFINQKPLGEYL